ncbi:unnamed protein product [Anisakis simplex]|uniref:MSP domain-containing protein n=1 Tax=Anisakis simplex TaxID=6269 RepID=A0A3P6PWZ4_ANISI|nr:unnamed protein product [Anisakis simplex]
MNQTKNRENRCNSFGNISLIMKITNRSRSRQSFKVKCTSNDLFRIRPSVGVLDRAESAYITLTYRFAHSHLTTFIYLLVY